MDDLIEATRRGENNAIDEIMQIVREEAGIPVGRPLSPTEFKRTVSRLPKDAQHRIAERMSAARQAVMDRLADCRKRIRAAERRRDRALKRIADIENKIAQKQATGED